MKPLTQEDITELQRQGVEICPYIRNPTYDGLNVYGRCSLKGHECLDQLMNRWEFCEHYRKRWGR